MVDESEVTVLNINVEEERRALRWFKLGGTVASAVCFGVGVRAAVQQARPLKSSDMSKPQLFSGVGFATRALLIATMITVSSFSLMVIGISITMKVNSLKQFGDRMKEIFGDKYRIKGSEISQEFRDIFKN